MQTDISQVRINSSAGLIAKEWIISYYTQSINTEYNSPVEYFQHKLGNATGLTSDEISLIKSRYFIYLGLIQIGLNDDVYKSIQAELMDSLQQPSHAAKHGVTRTFQLGNEFYSFSVYGDVVILYHKGDFTLPLHQAIRNCVMQLFGDNVAGLQMLSIDADKATFKTIWKQRPKSILDVNKAKLPPQGEDGV